MDQGTAVESLRRLGLSKYEAEVFIALQKLGTGTASDVDRITDVPRSQVYGAAESLEERGLAEVQQSNPIQYRAVTLEEARQRLRARIEREQDKAFDYLETVQGEFSDPDEEKEDIWTIHGRETVSDRIGGFVGDATERVVLGSDADLLDDVVVDALADRAATGIEVLVVSADESVTDLIGHVEGVRIVPVPSEMLPEDRKQHQGRILMVDDDTVLLSVLGDERNGIAEETAIWSAQTGFADVFVQMINGWFDDVLDV